MPTSPCHAAALAAMHRQVFPDDPWDAASFGVLLNQPGVTGWVDPRGGFLLVRAMLDEAEILTFGVTLRRQGIGLALLAHGIAILRNEGVATLHLEVAAGNIAARAFYVRAGFTQSGTRRRYYPDGSDALTLRLEI